MKKSIRVNDIFIDRVEEFAMLTTGLKGAKNYVLIAPRRFGKTTLVNKVFDAIRHDKEYLLISIDIMRYSGSIRQLAEGITEHCLHALGYQGKLQLLLKQINLSLQLKMSFGDFEIEPILNLLRDKSDDVALLGHALELFEKVAIKMNKLVIVFFDEFGELHGLGNDAIKVFRSVLQLQKNVCCVFAGSQETLMSAIFVEKNAPFFRFGDIVSIGALNQQEVIYFLSETGLDFNVSQQILTILECHPYYTCKVIGDLLLEPAYAVSTFEFFRYFQERLLPQESSYLEMLIQHIKSRTYALDILTNIAIGLEPSSGLEDKSRQTIYKLINYLQVGGYITKIKGAYKLTDPLLKLYLSQ